MNGHLPFGFALVSHSPWPRSANLRAIATGSGLPLAAGSEVCGADGSPQMPDPTSFSRARNAGVASVLTGLQRGSPHNPDGLSFSTLCSLLPASSPLPARFFLRERVGFLPVLLRCFTYQRARNARAHRLGFFLSWSDSLRRLA